MTFVHRKITTGVERATAGQVYWQNGRFVKLTRDLARQM